MEDDETYKRSRRSPRAAPVASEIAAGAAVRSRIENVTEMQQLEALADIHRLFQRDGIEYWLFGGWAVDFHAGAVTRPHADLDIAIWADGAFGADVAELRGVRARIIALDSLRVEKSEPRNDPAATAKDRADLSALAGL
jgi:hypothetical protein